MSDDKAIREQIAKILDWEEAHVGFTTASAGIPSEARGKQPAGLPYSPWQLIEHIRITQHDILEFCVNADYQEIKWPDDYWPKSPAPSSAAEWDDSIRRYDEDVKALKQLAIDPAVDVTKAIPHGKGQTVLRELLLVADHTSHHVGELVVVRRLLGIWKK